MRTMKVLAALIALAGSSMAGAHAATINDPTGDFLPSYQGPHDADLDVVDFSVSLKGGDFVLSGTMAGAIDRAGGGVYVIGVDTGAGKLAPFADIGEPGVRFDQTIDVFQNGSVTLGSSVLGPATISGNTFTILAPSGLLPSTGSQDADYAFTLWPEATLGVKTQISDFAPDNAGISVGVSTVPLPPALPMFGAALAGLALVGARMRARGAVAPGLSPRDGAQCSAPPGPMVVRSLLTIEGVAVAHTTLPPHSTRRSATRWIAPRRHPACVWVWPASIGATIMDRRCGPACHESS